MSALIWLLVYLFYVSLDGDYLNDFLTYMPGWAAHPAQLLGMLLALVLGYGL